MRLTRQRNSCRPANHLPFPTGLSIAALPLPATGHDPDQEHVADDLTAAAAPVAAPSDWVSDVAGEYAPLHDDRVVGSALVEQGVTPKARRRARTPLFAVAAIGLVSLPVLAVWWLLSSTAPPAPHASLALASDDRGPAQDAGTVDRRPSLHQSQRAMRSRTISPTGSPTVSSATLCVRCPESPSSPATRRSPTKAGPWTRGRSAASWRYATCSRAASLSRANGYASTSELAETSEGNQLWAERFDTERKGILQVQDEIVGTGVARDRIEGRRHRSAAKLARTAEQRRAHRPHHARQGGAQPAVVAGHDDRSPRPVRAGARRSSRTASMA